MYLKTCAKSDIKTIIQFIKGLYKDNPFYRDSMTPVLKDILYGKSVFCRNKEILPILVFDNAEVVATATIITTDKMPDALQLAFFEAKEGYQRAIDMMVDFAKKIGLEKGVEKIIVGLNGHVNYGLGLLIDHHEEVASFGNNYNPAYYTAYFEKYDPVEYGLTSFHANMNTFHLKDYQTILYSVKNKFRFRPANFSRLKEEVENYTNLNNLCFKDHPFYYERSYEEDYELFKQFRLFIKEENLLIAEKDGEPIGFMLWYPDFNQLIPPGGVMGLGTFLRNKFMSEKINKFKLVEIGVIPAYQGTGAILGLFELCMNLTKDRYSECETGWILDTNNKSKGFGIKWDSEEYKHYRVFEIKI